MFKKGNIVWIRLYTTSADKHLQQGLRPAVVLGNKKACAFSPILTILPMTSKTGKEQKIPTHCLVRRNDTIGQKLRDSVVLTEQMRSVSKENVVEVIDSLTPSKMQEVERNVKAQLGIA